MGKTKTRRSTRLNLSRQLPALTAVQTELYNQTELLKKYRLRQTVGKGAYSQVVQVQDLSNKNKKLIIKSNFSNISHQTTLRQMKILKNLRFAGSRFPQTLNIIVGQKNVYYVQEYCQFTPFDQILQKFTVNKFKHYLLELLLALNKLKQKNVFHRDIKPENFLYNPKTKHGVLIDFGLAQPACTANKIYDPKENQINQKRIFRSIKGTSGYIPIQLMLGQKYTYKSQMWSVGIIMFSFFTGKRNTFGINAGVLNAHYLHIVDSDDYKCFISFLLQLCIFGKEKVKKYLQSLGLQIQLPQDLQAKQYQHVFLEQKFDEHAKDLLSRLLEVDPLQRISVQQAIEHPFFEQIKHEHAYE